MTSVIQALGGRIIGTIESVTVDRIDVVLDLDAPQVTALNSGLPNPFPRINGYVLIPNESGATVGMTSAVRVARLPLPKRRDIQQDLGLVDLPSQSRLMNLIPLGTLRMDSRGVSQRLEMRRGVDVFPAVGDPVLLPDSEQLAAIVRGESQADRRILIGRSPTAGWAPVYVDPDKLFGRHLAVLGNTGAGKSCSVAGLVRWSLDAAKSARLETALDRSTSAETTQIPNARFIVLDPNGEYSEAFEGLNARLFRVDTESPGRPLHVPAWLWNGAEWAAFTGAAPGVQRPILFEALRRLRSDLGPPDRFETKVRSRIRRYLNRMNIIIQSGEHQQSGIREGVAQVLLNIQQDFEKLAVECGNSNSDFRISLQTVANRAQEAEESARSNRRQDGYWHNDFPETDLEMVENALRLAGSMVELDDGMLQLDEGTPREFPVRELPDYVDGLAADQAGRDIAQFVDTLSLRIRSLLTHGRLASILQPVDSASVTLEGWLTDYIGDDQAKNGPIAVIDLSLVPSDVVHIIVSVLCRMIFEAVQRYRREHGVELPTALVLEEAHTFVHRSLQDEMAPPAGRECTRILERIAREGRKFGLGLVLASQRPSEISPTVLSQCNTFLLHRLVNDRDQDLMKRLVPDGLDQLLREVPSFPTRRALLVGWAAPAPTLIEVRDLDEEYRPHSPDPSFWDVWMGRKERSISWKGIAEHWQGRKSDNAADQVDSVAADHSTQGP